jgi:hypothetical protein
LELSQLSSMSSSKPQQRQMGYLCGWCLARYGLHRGPWKIASGPVSIKEGKDTRLSHVLCSLYCGMLFLKLSCMYGIFIPYMYSWTEMMSSRKVINAIFWIWFLSIRLETQGNSRRHSFHCPLKRMSYLWSIPNISQAKIAAKYKYYFTAIVTF